jgi:hypothetical protein
VYVTSAKLGKGRLVDLHVATAGHRQGFELGAKRGDDVIPESIDVLVGMGQYRLIASAEMERAGAGNRDFRTEARLRFDDCKIVDMDRLGPVQATTDERNRLRRSPVRARIRNIERNIAEPPVEIAVIGRTAEFAIGREPQSDPLLQLNRRTDSAGLRFEQRGVVDLVPLMPAPRIAQSSRSQ